MKTIFNQKTQTCLGAAVLLSAVFTAGYADTVGNSGSSSGNKERAGSFTSNADKTYSVGNVHFMMTNVVAVKEGRSGSGILAITSRTP